MPTAKLPLLSGVSPGVIVTRRQVRMRTLPLLERAGLDRNGKCLHLYNSIVHAGQRRYYGVCTLPTNIMFITDGQWILTLWTFSAMAYSAPAWDWAWRAPAAGHNKRRQKDLAAQTLKMLASYRFQAEEFSHFGSELGPEAKKHSLPVNVVWTAHAKHRRHFRWWRSSSHARWCFNLCRRRHPTSMPWMILHATANDFVKTVTEEGEYQIPHEPNRIPRRKVWGGKRKENWIKQKCWTGNSWTCIEGN